jgi:BirA family biotin operon repressor/biotin-[acetyl-CoA-carboxylase] ligase
VEWVVAGVGLNVAEPAEPARTALPGAAYLDREASGASRPAVAAAVLDGIADAYRRFVSHGFAPMREAWNARDVLRGADVIVCNAAGAEIASGRAEGVDDEGRLLVTSASGTHAVPAGEVTLRRS